jgi:hypothetical protein
MTKKWSSTTSMDGQTKRQASRKVRREFAEAILKADREPPEASFHAYPVAAHKRQNLPDIEG